MSIGDSLEQVFPFLYWPLIGIQLLIGAYTVFAFSNLIPNNITIRVDRELSVRSLLRLILYRLR